MSPDTAAALAAIAETAATPFERARGLPPVCYTDPGLLDLELRAAFGRGWVCLGLAAPLAEPGAYRTWRIADQPIVVIRQKDGSLVAFANVCRHRMMRLLDGEGTCGKIVCPYHAWTYAIDGRLIGAPFMGGTEGFEKGDWPLAPIRCEAWQGWVFATLDPDAPALAPQLAPLAEVTARYGMERYVQVAAQDHVWQTNWKLLTENFMESYHLPVAHRRTVGQWCPVERTRFREARCEAATWQFFEKRGDADYGVAHPSNEALEGDWRHTSVMPTIYPSHMYVLAPDHVWWLTLMPKGVGEVTVRFGAAIAPERLEGLDDPDAFLATTVEFFDQVNDEDRMVTEGIFRGARAPLSEPGPYSWLERSLHDFAIWQAGLHGPSQARAEAAE